MRFDRKIFQEGLNRKIKSTWKAKFWRTTKLNPKQNFIHVRYFHHVGNNHMVAVDRYSNWLIVEKAKDGSKGLIDILW